MKSSSTLSEMSLADLVIFLWKEVGVRAAVKVIDESEFMSQRKSGGLACYSAMWTADYDDPDNFAYTFFGSKENTTFRSICYANEDAMERVRKARAIRDADERIKEYQELERLIVQEDATWIPLFKRMRLYLSSERLENFSYIWNGSVKSDFRHMSVS